MLHIFLFYSTANHETKGTKRKEKHLRAERGKEFFFFYKGSALKFLRQKNKHANQADSAASKTEYEIQDGVAQLAFRWKNEMFKQGEGALLAVTVQLFKREKKQ